MISAGDRTGRARHLLARRGDPRGRTVLVVGGLHGNEPDGLRALEELDRELTRIGVELRVDLWLVRGNVAALEARERFLERDLNRAWTDAALERLEARDPGELTGEDREQRELLDLLRAACGPDASGPATTDGPPEPCLIDLHASSAEGAPFCIPGPTASGRALSAVLPVPAVLGLNEHVRGALMSWFETHLGPSLVLEGGQQDRADTEQRLLDGLWVLLEALGAFDRSPARVGLARERLGLCCHDLPHTLRLAHVHEVAPEDGFEMGLVEGRRFRTFDQVHRGDPIGEDRGGAVRAPLDGYLVMPLYQPGAEGYFLATEVG